MPWSLQSALGVPKLLQVEGNCQEESPDMGIVFRAAKREPNISGSRILRRTHIVAFVFSCLGELGDASFSH